MAQRIIAYDDTEERMVRTTKDPADVGTASSTGEAVDAGSQAVASSATSQAITYTNAFSNTLYAVVAQMVNVTDSLVQYQPLTITSKSTSGCTVSWNAPTDSGNYVVDYIAADPCITYRGGDFNVSNSTTSLTSSMFLASQYALVGQHHNSVDSLPLFQPSTWVIQEAPNDATVIPTWKNLWNVQTDSGAYDFDFLGNQSNCSTIASFMTNVGLTATSVVINFPFFDLESNSYAVAARFQNLVDAEASVLFQPITVTSKSASSFTAKWNTPTPTANYKIEWICNIVTT